MRYLLVVALVFGVSLAEFNLPYFGNFSQYYSESKLSNGNKISIDFDEFNLQLRVPSGF